MNANATGDILYIEDNDVSPQIDQQLRDLLSICFDDQPVFKTQRFNKEIPQHRWYIQSYNKIIAHVAVHDKTISINNTSYRIGGIAEVAVHPEHRGKGYVREILKVVHKWLTERSFEFAMLLGEAKVYASSGYVNIPNEIHYYDTKTQTWETHTIDCVMIKPIINDNWPELGVVDLTGPTF